MPHNIFQIPRGREVGTVYQQRGGSPLTALQRTEEGHVLPTDSCSGILAVGRIRSPRELGGGVAAPLLCAVAHRGQPPAAPRGLLISSSVASLLDSGRGQLAAGGLALLPGTHPQALPPSLLARSSVCPGLQPPGRGIAAVC